GPIGARRLGRRAAHRRAVGIGAVDETVAVVVGAIGARRVRRRAARGIGGALRIVAAVQSVAVRVDVPGAELELDAGAAKPLGRAVGIGAVDETVAVVVGAVGALLGLRHTARRIARTVVVDAVDATVTVLV